MNTELIKKVYGKGQPKTEVEKAILRAGCLTSGHYKFADGAEATIKLDLEELVKHPLEHKVVVEALAAHPSLREAQVLLCVPAGAQNLFAEPLSKMLNITVARLERVPGGARQDFRFKTTRDKALALKAKRVCIVEDTVTTLSSVSGVVRLLEPERQAIKALAVWRRGEVKPAYRQNIDTDEYLVEQPIPLN